MPISPDQTGEQAPDEPDGWATCAPGDPNDAQREVAFATAGALPLSMREFNLDTHAIRFTVERDAGLTIAEYEVSEEGALTDRSALDFEDEDGGYPNIERLSPLDAYEAGLAVGAGVRWAILTGDPRGGFEIIGPFASQEACEDHVSHWETTDWWPVEIADPSATARTLSRSRSR